MKRFYMFAMAAMCSTMLFAEAGMFDVRINMALNGGGAQEYVLADDGALQNSGVYPLGDISGCVINAIDVLVWKDNGWDITSVSCHWSLNGSAGSNIAFEWKENIPNTNNQRWGAPSSVVPLDLLSQLNMGDYTLTLDFTYHYKDASNNEADVNFPGCMTNWNPQIQVFTITFKKVAAPAPIRMSLIPGAWADASAKIAMWYWNDNGLQGWSNWMVADQWGVMHAEIPAAATKVKFARFDPQETTPSWNSTNKWNEGRDDLTIGECKQLVVSSDGAQAYDNGKMIGAWDCTTALDEAILEGAAGKKIMRDGQVVIIRDGKAYDLKGAEL